MIGRRRTVPRFLGVGAAATAVHYGLMTGLVEMASWPPVLAAVAGFVAGAVVNYLLNRRYTFASRRAHREGAPRFVLMLIFACTLNAALVWALIHGFGWHYLVAQAVATGAVLVTNYLTLRYWVFAEARPHD